MVQGATISAVLARDLLNDPNFVEPALLLRATEGHRDPQHGEFVPGAAIETAVNIVQAPVTGQERMTVEAGLRDEDLRKFWYAGDIASMRYGLTNGDRIVLGRLGTAQNRFTGADRLEAERLRDQYAAANAIWFALYQAGPVMVIQLNGFGHPVYQRYDATDGHWMNTDTYRAMRANRWGPFTEVMGVQARPRECVRSGKNDSS